MTNTKKFRNCLLLLTAAIIWGMAFVITSVISAGLELVFIVTQRFNRPRIIRMLAHRQNAQKKKENGKGQTQKNSETVCCD